MEGEEATTWCDGYDALGFLTRIQSICDRKPHIFVAKISILHTPYVPCQETSENELCRDLGGFSIFRFLIFGSARAFCALGHDVRKQL